MKKTSLLLSAFLVAVLAIVTSTGLKSNINFPQPHACLDPSRGVDDTTPNPLHSCAYSGCHPGTAVASSPDSVTILIDADAGFGTPNNVLNDNFHYAPNTTYYISFAIKSFTGAYGFQMTALDLSNNPVDSFIVTNTNTTKLTSLAPDFSPRYIGHKLANSTKSWSFKWVSPSSATGTVKFYYAYNTSNQDDLTNEIPGGVIYYGTATTHLLGTGVDEVSNFEAVNVYPNPVSTNLGIAFDLKQTETVSVNIYNAEGKLCKELSNEKTAAGTVNRNFDISQLATGIYIVRLTAGNSVKNVKIVKQ